jgi:hypothetical protein
MRRFRAALNLIVILTSVIGLFAGAHWRRLEADAGPVALTMAHRPEPRPHKSASEPPKGDEQLSPQRALAFLVLMLKEGRFAR